MHSWHGCKAAAGKLGQRVSSSSSDEVPSDGPSWDPELEQPALIADQKDEPIRLPEEWLPGLVSCNGFLVDCYRCLQDGQTEAHFAATYEALPSEASEPGVLWLQNRKIVLASFYKDQRIQRVEVETLTLLARYVLGFPAPLCCSEAHSERFPYFVIKQPLTRTVDSSRLLSDADSVLWGVRMEARERGDEDFNERFHSMRGQALSYISLACQF